jgi:imidazolonepropionase-like amidohydrolase
MKHAKLFFIAIFILLSAFVANAQIIAIKAGKLVNPETGTTAVNQIILVEKGKIKEVGANLSIPKGANVIDLSTQTVLPGLFDCHTHMCQTLPLNNRSLFAMDMQQPTAFRAIWGVRNAKDMLDAGFTTIRDVGNNGDYGDTALRMAIEQNIVPGPTMINAGRIIAPYGGQYHLMPHRKELGEPEYLYADTRDEMKKAIRQNIQFGALVIKIVVDDQKYIYSAEDIKYMVEEARLAGLRVAAHCMTEQGARNAILGGVASIEHGFQMSDEALEMAKKANVVLVGTDFTVKAALALGLNQREAEWFHGIFLDRLKRAHKIGVTMAYGTDTFSAIEGETRGTIAMSFIDSFTEAKIPAKDILKIMTTNAADLLAVANQRGAIKAGQYADIIATTENPLDDINALKKVSFVMKNGSIFKQANGK